MNLKWDSKHKEQVYSAFQASLTNYKKLIEEQEICIDQCSGEIHVKEVEPKQLFGVIHSEWYIGQVNYKNKPHGVGLLVKMKEICSSSQFKGRSSIEFVENIW